MRTAVSLLALAVAALCTTAGVHAAEPSANAPLDEATFDVWEFRVLGNSVLPTRDVERAVYAHLGPARTIANVESARAALEAAYREAGFGTVFVDIPEQDTAEGIVRLRVTEGRVDRIRVTGARYFSNRQILAAVPSLERGEVPRLPDVQAELAGVNALSRDRAVIPVLKAGRAPGAVDVELKVEDSLPLHASVELNDRYSAGTARLRTTVALSYDNLFQRQQSLALQYQLAPEEPDNLEAFVASYVFRLEALPQTTLFLWGVRSDTDVAALGTLSVLGNGTVIGARAVRALPQSATLTHSLTLGVDYKDFVEDVRLTVDDSVQTPIDYLNWSLAYGGAVRRESATYAFNAAANFGVRGVVNDTFAFAEKRYLGAPNYFYVRGGVERTGRLAESLQLFTRLGAQYTASPLITNEQLALGGVDTVRGYLESNVLGDYGAYGNVELRSSWPFRAPALADKGYVLLFVDSGVVALLDPLPGQARRAELASWGAGLRLSRLWGFDLAVDWARALRDAGEVESGDDRAHFSVRYEF